MEMLSNAVVRDTNGRARLMSVVASRIQGDGPHLNAKPSMPRAEMDEHCREFCTAAGFCRVYKTLTHEVCNPSCRKLKNRNLSGAVWLRFMRVAIALASWGLIRKKNEIQKVLY